MAIDTFYSKRNDTNVSISGWAVGGAVYDITGAVVTPAAPVDLTGATLLLQCRPPHEDTPVISRSATPDPDQSANKGKWSATLTGTDLANEVADYWMTLQATWGDGTVHSFPSHGYNTLVIEEEVN